MNFNKKGLLLFLIIAMVIIYIEYENNNLKKYELPSKSILYLDENIFKMYSRKYDTDRDLNRFWGFPKDKKELTTELNQENNITKKNINVIQNYNSICIEKSCYRLLGIHYNYKIPMISLYNKDNKEKVKDYRVEEMLELNITVNKITENSVEFKELTKERKWIFKLFDVNQTKYKPKEIEE